MSEASLRLQHVSKSFGELLVVDDVSLEIPGGAFATLLGPSGCGKTTTLRMIAGFENPDSGSILLGDRLLNEQPANRRGTAMVFQDYALFPHMTVRGNVGYGLRLARTPAPELRRKVDETLLFVGLDKLADRHPNQLSGGQQQRVALARALAITPTVLLLDEPLSNLDARLREELRWELRTLQQRLGMTFVYVTHDQEEALSMSDWVAVMKDGRVEQAGSPADIYYRPSTAFVATFVGTANLVPEAELAIPGPRPGSDACIRPETIRIGPAAGDEIALHGVVRRTAFLGAVRRYWVEVGQREWIIDHPNPGAEPIGGSIDLAIDPARVHFIPPPNP